MTNRWGMRARRGLLGLALLLAGATATAEQVTLNLKDADIATVAATVSEITGKNFILDPRVKGKITIISSKPMEKDEIYQVFLSILQVHGFSAVPMGSVTKIIPNAQAKQDAVPTVPEARREDGDEVVTQVIPVQNVSAAQLVPILRPLVPPQGHLAAHNSSNVLIVSDSAANIARLVKIVQRIDQSSGGEIEVVPLIHASAADLVRVLSSLEQGVQKGEGALPNAVKLVADERTNSILVSGDKNERLRLKAIIAHLDTPLQSGGDIQVVYLRYSKAEDLAKVLEGVSKGVVAASEGKPAGGAPAPSAADSVQIHADATTNALVINAPPDVMRSLLAVVRQLDVRRAQVLVEAIIAELSQDRTRELGIQWQHFSDLTGKGGFGGTAFGSDGANIGSIAANPASAGNGLTLGLFNGTRTALDGSTVLNLNALLRALAGDADTNVLSTPSLVTMDNEEAQITVGENRPFVTGQYTTNTSGGTGTTVGNPFQTIQREDIGLKLKIRPQINEGDAIKLEIEQEVSSVNPASTGADNLITNKRYIKTAVMVEDSQIVVLGGLMDDTLTQNVQKVPLVGDVPLLGALFRYKNDSLVKRNLMVFLRPVIMRDAATANGLTFGKYNLMRDEQRRIRQGAEEDGGKGRSVLPPVLPPYLPKLENLKPKQPLPPAERESSEPAPPPAAPPPAAATAQPGQGVFWWQN